MQIPYLGSNDKKMIEDARWVGASERPSATKAIIFIHGLGSTATSTWGRMLDLCVCDPALSDFAFFRYEYPTHKSGLRFWKPLPTLNSLAKGLQTEIDIRMSRFSAIFIVAHSMGGLIARRLIVDQIQNEQRTCIKRSLLLATPNSGAALAIAASTIFPDQPHTKLLRPYSEALTELNDQWVTTHADNVADVWLVAGGIDQIVSEPSVRGIAGRKLDGMLIEYDHFNITKPKDENASNYLLLKAFLWKSVSTSPALPMQLEGDPLFEAYRLKHEPYYVRRQDDDLISISASSGHIWITGPSGVGKTAAITRYAIINDYTLFQIYLGSYTGSTSIQLLKALYIELADRLNIAPNVVETPDSAEIMIALKSIFRSIDQQGPVLIVIEEIPFVSLDEEVLFCTYLKMLFETLEAAGMDQIFIACTSINDPLRLTQQGMGKFRAKMHILSLLPWNEEDCFHLAQRIRDALNLNVSNEALQIYARASGGVPRFVKAVMRKHRSANGSHLNADDVVKQTSMETV